MFIIPMFLCDADSDIIYTSADIVLTSELPTNRPGIEPLVLDGGDISTTAEIYSSGHLFHGPLLQGLKQVISNDNGGIIALSANADIPVKWMDNPLRDSWITDPQVLDSSFQMMILWSFANKDLGSLPSFAGKYRQYCESFPQATRIQCRVTKVSNNSACANIDFLDERSRQLLARLEGYECTMTENLHQSFLDNKI